jgi:hypothetical protein
LALGLLLHLVAQRSKGCEGRIRIDRLFLAWRPVIARTAIAVTALAWSALAVSGLAAPRLAAMPGLLSATTLAWSALARALRVVRIPAGFATMTPATIAAALPFAGSVALTAMPI